MTTLKDLKNLIEKCETFGLQPEEINVEFKSGGNVVSLLDANACVSAMAEGVKPKLTITFTGAGTPYQGR